MQLDGLDLCVLESLFLRNGLEGRGFLPFLRVRWFVHDKQMIILCISVLARVSESVCFCI